MALDVDKCVAEVRDLGHCVLPRHFPQKAIHEFHRGFLPLLDTITARIPEGNRGPNRWAIGVPFAHPFYQSAFFDDDAVNEIVSCILGDDMFIAYYGTDTPKPGAEDQQIHSDVRPLFSEHPDLQYPPPTLSVRFVTVDMTLENGPYVTSERTQLLSPENAQTQIDAGEMELKPLLLQAGDVLISDPRTRHRGTANCSNDVRPFAVVVYNRSWFQLDSEFRLEANEETPMLTESFYRRLSPAEQKLLRRVPRTGG